MSAGLNLLPVGHRPAAAAEDMLSRIERAPVNSLWAELPVVDLIGCAISEAEVVVRVGNALLTCGTAANEIDRARISKLNLCEIVAELERRKVAS